MKRPILPLLASLLSLLLTTPLQAELTLLEVIELDDPANGHEPWGVAACSATHRVYVACIHGPSQLMVIDGVADSIVAHAPLTGPYPHGVAVNSAGDRVYVSSTGGSLSIVDAHSLAELHVIQLGGTPVDLAFREGGGPDGTLYVANQTGAELWVLDAGSGGALRTINVGAYPTDIAINELTARIYVTNLSDWTVSVIDAASDSVLATIPVGAYPDGISVDTELNLVYVVNRDDGTVSLIDGVSHTVIATYPAGDSPRKVVVDPVTHLAYITCSGSGTISIVSPDGPLTIPIPVGLDPVGGICIDPGLRRFFVTNLGSDDVTAFDAEYPFDPVTIRFRFHPASVALAPPVGGNTRDRASLLVADRWGNEILHIDPCSGSPERTLPAGYTPTDVDARHLDGLIGVTVGAENALLLLDWDSGALRDRVIVGSDPRGLCMREDRRRAYVSNFVSGDLSVVDLDSAQVIDTIDLDAEAFDVAVNETTDRIYVTTWWGLLQVIDGSTHEILDTIGLSGWCEPNQLVVDEARNLIYVNGMNCNGTWVVDGVTHQVHSITLPGFPGGIAVNETLQHAYVCAGTDLVVIGPGHTIEEVVPMPSEISHCAADAEMRRVFISGEDDGRGRIYVLLDGDASDVPRPGTTQTPRGGQNVIRLSLGSPNPVRSVGAGGSGRVDLTLELCDQAPVTVGIFDAAGSLVRLLDGGRPIALGPGRRSLSWDLTDARGRPVRTGVYYLGARIPVHDEREAAKAGLRLVVIR